MTHRPESMRLHRPQTQDSFLFSPEIRNDKVGVVFLIQYASSIDRVSKGDEWHCQTDDDPWYLVIQ